METTNFLPDNDQDLQLALHLGSAIEAGESISSIQDPLIQKLLSFKDQEMNDIADLEDTSYTIWNQVEKKTISSIKATITSLPLRRTNKWAWAAAATVLIAAFTGIFWFTSLDQPVLIAQSDSAIESIILEDGSEIVLRPNSSLFKIKRSETKRAYKLQGEGFFTVAKDPNRPFSVRANTGTITVLGTQFNLSTWGDETNVYLEEGSVRLDLENVAPVILKPGEKATISGSEISTPSTADIDEFKDWLAGNLVLKRTPISKVVAEIEQHYKVTLDISNMNDTSELISGTIPLADLRVTLNDISVILGGTFREVNSNSFVFIPLN